MLLVSIVCLGAQHDQHVTLSNCATPCMLHVTECIAPFFVSTYNTAASERLMVLHIWFDLHIQVTCSGHSHHNFRGPCPTAFSSRCNTCQTVPGQLCLHICSKPSLHLQMPPSVPEALSGRLYMLRYNHAVNMPAVMHQARVSPIICAHSGRHWVAVSRLFARLCQLIGLPPLLSDHVITLPLILMLV